MAIARTPIIDDDGSMSVGTVFENAWKVELYDQIDAALAALVTPVQSYTPVWGTTGVQPVLGNGTLVGRYVKMGPLIWVNLTLTFGSTTSAGSGGWIFRMPVAFAGQGINAAGLCLIGSAYALIGAYPIGNIEVNPFAGPAGSPGVAMDATHPATWGPGSWLDYYVQYRGVS